MAKNLILSLHIVAVISWMAGLLYLYRLFVYHVEETEAVVKQRFEVMERKLNQFIVHPAMGVTILAGIGLIAVDASYYLHQHWLHAKLLFVCGMIAMTIWASRARKKLAKGESIGSSKKMRVLNEVPTLLMIVIVLLVVCKPF